MQIEIGEGIKGYWAENPLRITNFLLLEKHWQESVNKYYGRCVQFNTQRSIGDEGVGHNLQVDAYHQTERKVGRPNVQSISTPIKPNKRKQTLTAFSIARFSS